jgi:ABC-2 type transport system permease protein
MNWLRHFSAFSKRSVINTVRQPAVIVPALIFPLMFLAMASSAMDRSTTLPGFPRVDSFLQFMIAATMIQGAIFGAISTGVDMAVDIEGGFFERLVSSPTSRTSIVAGRLTGAFLLGAFQTWFYFGVASIFGLDAEGGLVGVALVSLVVAVLSAGAGAALVALALKTGSAEAVQGSFPLVFVFMLISTAFFPRGLMDGWYGTLAGWNPVSYLIDGVREQFISGLDWNAFLMSLSIAVGIGAIGIFVSLIALRGRLKGAS